MIKLDTPDSSFEYGYSPLEGGHNADLKVLEPGQSLAVDGISCSAESPTDLSCETKEESFDFAGGKVTSAAPGLNASGTSSATTATESRADTSCSGVPTASGASITVQITGTTSMACDEVLDIAGHYSGMLTNMSKDDVAKYGNSAMREFDGWFCSAPSAGMVSEMGYSYKCTNEAEGKEFLAPA